MNTSWQVDHFLAKLDHPLKAEVQAVREIILGTDGRMTETVKWGGPTFMFNGNMATINLKSKKFVNLFFQTGSLIGERHGLLQGNAAQVRTAHFTDLADVRQKEAALRAVVRDWTQARS
jgi:uncharacterized protein YdeI (YjbR/CyaY-like superfamily)